MKRPSLRLRLPSLAVAASLVGIASPAGAITLGQIDDFQDGGIASWKVDAGQVNFSNVPDAGPLGTGDHVLNAECTNRFVFYNEAQWKGNYITAGVTKISMDVRNANDFPLALRIGIANSAVPNGSIGGGGSGNTYVTDYSIAVPNDGSWRRITFDITPDDFIKGVNNFTSSPSSTAALMNVTHLRLLHQPELGQFIGDVAPGSIRVNNILAEGPPVENADFDGDDDVDGEDFLIWQRGVGVATTQPAGDADSNGAVNGLDLAIWKEQFGLPATPVAAAIPEPASVCLAVLAGAIVRRRR